MPRRRTRTASTAAAAITVAALVLTGCASAEDAEPDDTATSASPTDGGTSSPSPDGSTEPSPTGVVVDITFDGDKVTPNGERIDAKVGEPVTLNIDADAGGELHVHSTPEQEIEYDAGTSTHEVTFDQPGIVDIESHDLEKVVVQVEVR